MSSFHIILFILLFETTKTHQFIDCGSIQCKRSYIICVDNENCDISCSSIDESCQSSIVLCPENADCNIQCNSTKACDKMSIYAQKSNALSLSCGNHSKSCNFMDVYCPQHKDGKTCNISGFDDFFEMAVYAMNGFNDIYFDIAASLLSVTIHCSSNITASIFDESCVISPTFPHTHCINNVTQCYPDLPTISPSSLPTMSPAIHTQHTSTFRPTALPSVSPTLNPSPIPTSIPSLSPTIQSSTSIPTLSPIIYTTLNTATTILTDVNDIPTTNDITTTYPSIFPTVTTTEEPSGFPTVLPTTEPTIISTLKPASTTTEEPSEFPTVLSTVESTIISTLNPASTTTKEPSEFPTVLPTAESTIISTTEEPSVFPTVLSTTEQTIISTLNPSSTTILPSKPTRKSIDLMTSTETLYIIQFYINDTNVDEISANIKPITIDLTNLLYVVLGIIFMCCMICGLCFVKNNIFSNSTAEHNRTKWSDWNQWNENIETNGYIFRNAGSDIDSRSNIMNSNRFNDIEEEEDDNDDDVLDGMTAMRQRMDERNDSLSDCGSSTLDEINDIVTYVEQQNNQTNMKCGLGESYTVEYEYEDEILQLERNHRENDDEFCNTLVDYIIDEKILTDRIINDVEKDLH